MEVGQTGIPMYILFILVHQVFSPLGSSKGRCTMYQKAARLVLVRIYEILRFWVQITVQLVQCTLVRNISLQNFLVQ